MGALPDVFLACSRGKSIEKKSDEPIRKRGRTGAPLQLQIANALRYLATGCPIDCNEEAAQLGRSTMQCFNLDFFEWFNTMFYDEWIMSKQPRDAAGLERLVKRSRFECVGCRVLYATAMGSMLRLRTNTVRTEHRTLYSSLYVRTTPVVTLRFS